MSIAVLAPNLLMLKYPPRPRLPAVAVPWPLNWLERIGQALCLVIPAITAAGTLVWVWSVPALLALAGYYALWARYLRRGQRAGDLYAPVWRVPVPMAILPVIVFLAAAGWLANPWIGVAGIVLAAGHIPSALIIARAVNGRGPV